MQSITVIGAGQMGAGIAQVSAHAGIKVLLADRTFAIAENAKTGIAKQLNRLVEKEKISSQDASGALDKIIPIDTYESIGDCDMIIEAATEREDIKRVIFEEAGKMMHDNAILASNTSSIPITRLAQSSPDAARFIGVHFFNPVPLMGLIEIIRGLATSDDTLARVTAYGDMLGKQLVFSQDAPGFIVNRILMPMLNEACFALGEGVASIRDIDSAVQLGLNHPMGPLTLADFVGLDTCLEITNVLFTSTGDPKFRPAPILQKYVEAGWYGCKSGRGFYDYSGDTPVPTR